MKAALALAVLLGASHVSLPAQSIQWIEVMGQFTGQYAKDPGGDANYGRGFASYGLHAAWKWDRTEPFLLRAHFAAPFSSQNPQRYALSLGTELRAESKKSFWGASMGVDLRLEHFRRRPETRTVWNPTPQEVQLEGLSVTTLRPTLTASVQWPGVFFFPYWGHVPGPLQPITRIQGEWVPATPRPSGKEGEFLSQLDSAQVAVQVGFRFR